MNYKKEDILKKITPSMMAAILEAADQSPEMMDNGTVMVRNSDGTEQDHYRREKIEGKYFWIYRATIKKG
jgi:hypothetical protein